MWPRISIAFLIILAGCSTLFGAPNLPTPATINVCPQIQDWTPEQIKTLGKEDEKLADTSMAHRAIAEDKLLRAQIKAACGDNHAST